MPEKMNPTLTTGIVRATLAAKNGSTPGGRSPAATDADRGGFSAILSDLDVERVGVDVARNLSDGSATNAGIGVAKEDRPSEGTDKEDLFSGFSETSPFMPATVSFQLTAVSREPSAHVEVSIASKSAADTIPEESPKWPGLTDLAEMSSGLLQTTQATPTTPGNAKTVSAAGRRTDEGRDLLLENAVSTSASRETERIQVEPGQSMRPVRNDYQFPTTASSAPPVVNSAVSALSVERSLESITSMIDRQSQTTAATTSAPARSDIQSGKLSTSQSNARTRELRTTNIGSGSPLSDAASEPAMARIDGLAGVAGALRMGADGQADLPASIPNAIHGPPASHASSTFVAPAAPIHLSLTVANPQWAEALGNAVMRMTAEKLVEATLTVSPAELGNISVKIDLEGRQVSVSFLVGNAEVHRAVEASLSRLQEMMAQSGLSLGQSSVGQEQPKPFFQGPAQLPLPRNLSARETPEEAQIAPVLPRRAAIGRVDMFA